MSRIPPVEGILAILDDATFTGTNKLSLLLAIIDLAPTSNGPNRAISFDEIALKVLEIHWPHTRTFALTGTPQVLRQVSSRNKMNATAVCVAAELQSIPDIPSRFESAVLEVEPSVLERSLKRVMRDVRRNPLARLQVLPGKPDNFLFEIDDAAREIQLFEQAKEDLIRYGPALRQVVELHFINLVLKFNEGAGPVADLHSHLFGAERHMPPLAIRQRLWELQSGRCLYTGQNLAAPEKSRAQSLDHVVPWSKSRISTLENFVVVSTRTNSSKRDMLLSLELLERWDVQVRHCARELVEISSEHNWPSDPAKTRAVLRQLYEVPTSLAVYTGSGVAAMPPSDRKYAIQLLSA